MQKSGKLPVNVSFRGMGMKQKEEEYKDENTMSSHPPSPNTHTLTILHTV